MVDRKGISSPRRGRLLRLSRGVISSRFQDMPCTFARSELNISILVVVLSADKSFVALFY